VFFTVLTVNPACATTSLVSKEVTDEEFLILTLTKL
jgi:hypothetical protein